MERKQNEQKGIPGDRREAGADRVTAFFDGREEMEIALADLERNGIPRNRIGMLIPEPGPSEEPSATHRKKTAEDFSPSPGSGSFSGWTTAMAPWMMAGARPVFAMGFLSMILQRDRPKDLRELASALGLSGDAVEPIQEGLQRQTILVAVEASEKQTIVSHILERNRGHLLPYKKERFSTKEPL